jgi:ppGpp synthetase/RelA/SpoT-type nucleotidyltranferase
MSFGAREGSSCEHDDVPSSSITGEINKACSRLAALRARTLENVEAIRSMPEQEIEPFLQDIQLVEEWRKAHAGPLRNTSANLRHYVKPHSAANPDIVSVTQRLKKFSTILDKQSRYPTMRVTKMEDIGGVRAVLFDQTAADDVARRLRKNWRVHRYRDYVRQPKDSGYRALHLIVVKQGMMIEVQLRTYLQDFWANQVESDSRHLRVDFKSGKGQQVVHQYYAAVSQFFAMTEASKAPPEGFQEELSRRYALAEPFLSPYDGGRS